MTALRGGEATGETFRKPEAQRLRVAFQARLVQLKVLPETLEVLSVIVQVREIILRDLESAQVHE